jgi:L-amino acid N-acyltransferase YncA
MDADHQSIVTAVAVDDSTGARGIVAAARYHLNRVTAFAEFSIIVQDEWQSDGVGGALLDYLIRVAKVRGVEGFEAFVSPKNQAMIALIHRLPFHIESSLEGDQYFYRIHFKRQR